MTNAYVDPTAIIDNGVRIGSGTKVWHYVHIMEDAQIGKECVIADYVYVGIGVKIGNNVKVENRATVYEGVTIEDKVFVGPHVTFTNDLYPRSFKNDWKILPTLVKEGSSLGARTVLICGTTIGKYAMIGAGSVVTENIPSHALAYGNPAKIRGFVCRCGRTLELEEKKKNNVSMTCPVCNKKYEIPTEHYTRI